MPDKDDQLKGMIPYPCCPKEKGMVYKNTHGFASYKCPRCGRFALFDFDHMMAYEGSAYKGAAHRFATL